MSRTKRAYNREDYYRKRQQEHEFRWTYIPEYHPFRQSSWSENDLLDLEGCDKHEFSRKQRRKNKQEVNIEMQHINDEPIDDEIDDDDDDVVHYLTEEQSKALQEHMHKFCTDPEYRQKFWADAIKNTRGKVDD